MTKDELEAENAQLKQDIEDLQAANKSMSKPCPACGFDPVEHERLVKEATPA